MNSLKSLLSFKTVYSENKTYLVFSVGKKETINYSQVQTLESDVYREFFLPFQCTKTTNTNKIGYDISGLTSLSEYLKTEMRQDQYFEIISGIQKIISFCQRSHFSTDNLVCDPKYMYYHNISRKIKMIYLPLNNQHYVCDDIPKCLNKMHKGAKNIIITDGNYMNNYEKYLEGFQVASRKHSKNYFTPDSLLHFFNSNHMNSIDSNIGEFQDSELEILDNTGFSINDQIDKSGIIETYSSSSNTTVRGRKTETFLTDENGNRIDITAFPFRIGRNKKNDIVLSEPTVSGEHAFISEQNGKFYINDLSSNGTFLNDENNRIKCEEIKNGDKLFFDCFCYTFGITRTEDESVARTVVVSRRHDNEKTQSESEVSRKNEKALAYLKKMSDGEITLISSFPFRSEEIAGMVIICENVGDRKALFIENISCGTLDFEGLDIPAGRKAELFSGCTITISGEKYSFNVENRA